MGGGLHKQKGPLGERALEDWRWVTAGVSQGPPSSAAQGQRAHRCVHLQQLCKVMCECGFCEHEIIIDDCFFSCQHFLNVEPNCFFHWQARSILFDDPFFGDLQTTHTPPVGSGCSTRIGLAQC